MKEQQLSMQQVSFHYGINIVLKESQQLIQIGISIIAGVARKRLRDSNGWF